MGQWAPVQFEGDKPSLVGGIPTPLKNMSLSVGISIPNMLGLLFPIFGELINVTNHQPDFFGGLQNGQMSWLRDAWEPL